MWNIYKIVIFNQTVNQTLANKINSKCIKLFVNERRKFGNPKLFCIHMQIGLLFNHIKSFIPIIKWIADKQSSCE